MGKIRLGALAGVIALAGLVGSAVAGAGATEEPHKAAAATSTNLKYSKGAFSGQISVERPDYPEHLDKYASTQETFYSAVDECLAHRKVALLKAVKARQGVRHIEVDRTRGDRDGDWSIERRGASGRFAAEVERKRVDTLAADPDYGVIVVCSEANTSVVRVRR